MDLVWKESSCTVREVHQKLKSDKLAYTTVATIVQRLYKKGLVEKKEQGKAFIFSPKLSKESYSKKLAKRFMHGFFDSFGNTAITAFAESVDQLPKERRNYLLKLLKK